MTNVRRGQRGNAIAVAIVLLSKQLSFRQLLLLKLAIVTKHRFIYSTLFTDHEAMVTPVLLLIQDP